MKNLTTISFGLAAAFLISCGDDKTPAVDAKPADAPADSAPDAFVPPAPPTLGAQIDRMGRPAVNTALNSVLDADPLKTTKKENYNKASMPGSWLTTQLDPGVATNNVRAEFAKYIGIFDVIDQGNTNIPTTPQVAQARGCGNSALYNPAANPPAIAYFGLATVLADDELYIDTAKGDCTFYLSLEVEVATSGGVPHTKCGGRTLTMDVVDISYSLLAAGLNGFDAANGFDARIKDGAVAHTDVSNDNFPFLGAPH